MVLVLRIINRGKWYAVLAITFRIVHPELVEGEITVSGFHEFYVWLVNMGYGDGSRDPVRESYCAEGYRKVVAGEEICFAIHLPGYPSSIRLRRVDGDSAGEHAGEA